MFSKTRLLPRGAASSRRTAAVPVFILATWILVPAGLHAAALQQAADTIPLAPIEVRVLRTPVLQNAAPLAVSALTGDDLQRGRSGFFLEEALQGLPGVRVQNRFNPAIGERVAIRGPASALFGNASVGNASGGVLSFTTRDPPHTPYNLEVMGITGSDGLWRGQLTASGTVENTVYLVTVSGQTWDGYRTIAINPDRPRADTLGTNYRGSERLGLKARVTTPLGGGELSLTANVLDLFAENAGSKADGTAVFREINDIYLRFRTDKTLEQQQSTA